MVWAWVWVFKTPTPESPRDFMENISIYLQKFKNFGAGDRAVKEKVIAVIKKLTGEELDSKLINLKDGEIRINVSGPMKSELYILKKQIEKELEKKLI